MKNVRNQKAKCRRQQKQLSMMKAKTIIQDLSIAVRAFFNAQLNRKNQPLSNVQENIFTFMYLKAPAGYKHLRNSLKFKLVYIQVQILLYKLFSSSIRFIKKGFEYNKKKRSNRGLRRCWKRYKNKQNGNKCNRFHDQGTDKQLEVERKLYFNLWINQKYYCLSG